MNDWGDVRLMLICFGAVIVLTVVLTYAMDYGARPQIQCHDGYAAFADRQEKWHCLKTGEPK